MVLPVSPDLFSHIFPQLFTNLIGFASAASTNITNSTAPAVHNSILHFHNVLTCKGFGLNNAAIGLNFGNCMKGRLALVLLFFVIAIIRKWGAEEWSIDFNFPVALALGIAGYLVMITLFGNPGVAFIVGIAASCVGGYGIGHFIGGGDGGGE